MKKTGMKLLAGVLFGALLAGCSAGQPEAGESAAPSASPVAEQPESIGAADAGRSGFAAPDGTEAGEEYYTFALSENVERRPVSYENRYGITLAGDLYTPRDMDESELHPAVVIGAPYGGVKEQGPGVWANELAQRGFVCLTFDPSYNGESGGEPRHVSSPEIFTEDVSAGVDYLGVQPFVDREKIGAIGICGSGAFSLSAAQMDTRIRAVVTASLVDISANFDGLSPEERQAALDALGEQRWSDFENGAPDYHAVYADEPMSEIPEGLDPMTAEFMSYYSTARGNHPNADGAFTTTSQAAFMNHSLLGHLDTISPRPVLMLAGENAMSRGLTEGVFERLGEAKELIIVPGTNHVDLYDDTEKIPFDEVERFLNESLKPGA